MKLRSLCRVTIALLAIGFLVSTCSGNATKKDGNKPGQKEPNRERVLEIQNALVSHGYTVEVTGKWDHQTQVALYKIADGMEWQVNHVPDARVLILLGLSKGDPMLAQQKGDHLDQAVRADKSLKKAVDIP